MEQLDLQGRKKGEFKVRLPDGRIQVTSYQAVNVDTFFLFTKEPTASLELTGKLCECSNLEYV